MSDKRLVVAGGGAAGFFSAIAAAENGFTGEIILLEKSGKLLTKVLISGGGRCNVTHACFENAQLIQHYPRGHKELQGPFSVFNTTNTINWFESKGIALKTEDDGRIFPVTDNSQTIADCLLQAAIKNNVRIKTHTGIIDFHKKERFELLLTDTSRLVCDYLIIATGGSQKPEHYNWITGHGHSISPPVPSLFTFNVPDSPFKGLEGIVANPCKIKIKDSSFENTGPLLFTHWGLSGPAVLKLSAVAARWISGKKYSFTISVSFFPDLHEEELKVMLSKRRTLHPNKKIAGDHFMGLSQRLWQRLCEIAGIHESEVWGQLKREKMNRLMQHLLRVEITVTGKTTYKEEFVTCGGIKLNEINLRTMESKHMKHLYFAGELLDIDGITGGFNFQNAWTTGWIAGITVAREAGKE